MADRDDLMPDADAPTQLSPTAQTLPAPTSSSGPGGVIASTAAITVDTFEARYESHRVLGAGGMGEVRLCGDGHIGREVAMKVMRAQVGGREDLQARFLREARVQGQLEHPAIVPVYDLGVAPDGAPYFTMKRLRGETLAQILQRLRKGDDDARARYTRRKLLSDFSTVCHAMELAHARGVLHRDLKPANIMVGDFGEVYVLDWGLAKVADAPDPAAPAEVASKPPTLPDDAQTAAGAVMGTPGYMAPEQLRGEALDLRADIYSLGAILFEVLTGEPLHPSANSDSVVDSTLRGADARASERAPSADVPPELEAICVRATADAPADRYASVRDMTAAIERFLDGDRDLERRRVLADEHAARAREAAAAAGNDVERRKQALREAGQALALDPEHPDARATLMRLLLEPPAHTPDEVALAVRSSTDDMSRWQARIGAKLYLAWLLVAPPCVAMGIRDWPLAMAITACILALAVWAYVFGRSQTLSLASLTGAVALNAVCLGLMSRAWGPLVLIPSVTAASTVMFSLHAAVDRKRVYAFVALGIGGVVVPLVLEWLGVIAPSYRFEDNAITILPNLFDFPPALTLAAMVACSITVIVAAAGVVSALRQRLHDAEHRLHMHAWQMKQLVPDDAGGP